MQGPPSATARPRAEHRRGSSMPHATGRLSVVGPPPGGCKSQPARFFCPSGTSIAGDAIQHRCSPPGVTRKGGAPALHPRPSAPVARSQARYTWAVAAPPVSSHSSPRRCSLCSADAPRRSAALCRATGSADAPPVGRARALSLLGSTDLGAAQTVGTAALRSHACGSLHSPERRSTAAAAQLVRSAHQRDNRLVIPRIPLPKPLRPPRLPPAKKWRPFRKTRTNAGAGGGGVELVGPVPDRRRFFHSDGGRFRRPR